MNTEIKLLTVVQTDGVVEVRIDPDALVPFLMAQQSTDKAAIRELMKKIKASTEIVLDMVRGV